MLPAAAAALPTARLTTRDTTLVLAAGPRAPRLVSLSTPGAPAWTSAAPEALISRVRMQGHGRRCSGSSQPNSPDCIIARSPSTSTPARNRSSACCGSGGRARNAAPSNIPSPFRISAPPRSSFRCRRASASTGRCQRINRCSRCGSRRAPAARRRKARIGWLSPMATTGKAHRAPTPIPPPGSPAKSFPGCWWKPAEASAPAGTPASSSAGARGSRSRAAATACAEWPD